VLEVDRIRSEGAQLARSQTCVSGQGVKNASPVRDGFAGQQRENFRRIERSLSADIRGIGWLHKTGWVIDADAKRIDLACTGFTKAGSQLAPHVARSLRRQTWFPTSIVWKPALVEVLTSPNLGIEGSDYGPERIRSYCGHWLVADVVLHPPLETTAAIAH
jgi:hypothetical protein